MAFYLVMTGGALLLLCVLFAALVSPDTDYMSFGQLAGMMGTFLLACGLILAGVGWRVVEAYFQYLA